MHVNEKSEESGSFTSSVFDELSKNGLWRRDSMVEEVKMSKDEVFYA